MYLKLNSQYFFSYFGLAPFFIIIIDKYLFFKIEEEIIINFLIYYTLLIFVFIGSINWNFESRIKNYIVMYGFLPSLFSTIIILLNLYNFNKFYLFLLIATLLLIQLLVDYLLIYSYKRNKNIFYYLRLPLTLSIIFLQIIIIL